MQSIKIYGSRLRAIKLIAASLICGAMFAGLYFYFESKDWNDVFVILLALWGIVGFLGAATLVYGLITLIKRPVLVVIDELGITTRQLKKQLIEWGDITGFTEAKGLAGQIILIEVRNPHDLIANEKNKYIRQMMEGNMSKYGTPFQLVSGTYTISHQEVLDLVEEAFHKYGGKTDSHQ